MLSHEGGNVPHGRLHAVGDRIRAHVSGSSRLRILRFLAGEAPAFAAALGALVLAGVGLSMAMTVATGDLVGRASRVVGRGLQSPEGRELVRLLVVVAALTVTSTLLGTVTGVVQSGLTYRITRAMQRRVMSASLGPKGIAHLEGPRFAEEAGLALGTNTGQSPVSGVQGFIALLQARLSAVGSAVLLAGFRWWAPLLLAGAYTIHSRWVDELGHLVWAPWLRSAPELRRADYLRGLAVGPGPAKEVRVFGLAAWIIDRFSAFWLGAMGGIWRTRAKLRRTMAIANGSVALAYAIVLVLVARAGARGEIDLGRVAIYAQAALGMQNFGGLPTVVIQLRHGGNALAHLLGLNRLAFLPESALAGSRTEVAGMPSSEISLESVTFRYPGSERTILRDLDLHIRAGTSMAIVGENGAGKSTLVKLLARLYDPTAGRITVDGTGIADLDPSAWRERVSVIFQDFVRYPLPLRDNVAFGALGTADERSLEEAVRLAGAADLPAQLPRGWDTVLSRRYRDGAELSGGQWQKVALARALLAARTRGGLLVLDEPTANLDVRAEAELFERFLELTRGTTTILISHRFSTVRRADRICVLEHGRVAEEGSHDELVALGGLYARMFALQAERFQ